MTDTPPQGAGAPPAPPRRAAPLKLALILAVGVGLGWLAWSLFTPAAGTGRSLPELTLEQLDGGRLNLASLQGEPVVVNLWATWCLPCLRELPLLADVAEREPGVRFVFADQGESRQAVEAYLAGRPELRLERVLLDRDVALGVEFETLGLPMTLFFDEQGRHVRSHVGELNEEQLTGYLADLKRGALRPL